MAKSMIHHDQRPAELYENLTVQWARQTAAYVHSVRLYQEQVGRRRRQRPESPEPSAQIDLMPGPGAPRPTIVDVPGVIAIRPPLDAVAPPPAPAERRGGDTPSPLTARQLEIAELIAQGLTNSQIAERIVVSRGTVGNHIGHMLRRLGVHNRAQIAAWMIRHSTNAG